MTLKFVSIDVETANADLASICQIGLAFYQDGSLSGEWSTYVNPNDYFDGINISIHGIDEATVSGAPTFKEVEGDLRTMLENNIVVSHTHFDRTALSQAANKSGVPPINCQWLDSATIARRTWSQFSKKGYGLKNLCNFIDYEFKHHDALEDAKAAGQVILSAYSQSELDLNNWLIHIDRPSSSNAAIAREGNPDGTLFGEVIVFTGALLIPRREAAELASKAGCTVRPNVTKRITILVVGDQDVTKLAGNQKSSKHRKTEQLILKGSPIRIIRESDFQKLIES